MGGRLTPPTGDQLKKVKRFLHDAGIYGALSLDSNTAPVKPAGEGEVATGGPAIIILFKDNESGAKVRVEWESDPKNVANKIIKARGKSAA
jgi:hypothetical protein